MVISTAPGRCGVLGNPTDMYGGTVISVTTAERAKCVMKPADALVLEADGAECVLRCAGDLQPAGDGFDLARAVLRSFGIDPATAGHRMRMSTEVPVQSGMAGSSALIVAVAGAVCRWHGISMDPWSLAETARRIECDGMGILCGLQDQHMAVFGGLNYMDFAGKAQLEQRDDEPLATIEPLAPHIGAVPLIAVHTGIRHHSGNVHRSARDRWLAGEDDVVRGYAEIARLARLGKRALLRRNWLQLGALMNENHAIVAGLGGSAPANDRLIMAARAAGAYGAKLSGAGGGGTVVALAEDPDAVAQAMLDAGGERVFLPAPGPGLTVLSS